MCFLNHSIVQRVERLLRLQILEIIANVLTYLRPNLKI